MSAAIRVLLADDQPLIRAGLCMVVADADDLEIVGEAGTGLEAVRLVHALRPDVVVMDIRMPGLDGVQATSRITREVPSTRVVMLTTFDEDENVYSSLRAGASGFLVKDMALDDILTAVRVVAAGDALLAPSVTRRLIADFTARPEAAPGPIASAAGTAPPRAAANARARRKVDSVTAREREVLLLVGRGLSNAEIAAGLFISLATVKAHITNILAKLDARDRIQLVILAYESGLLP
jgi:DNA-binding NarL/FixJ family response regulator